MSLHQLETDVGFDILFGRLSQRFLHGRAAGVFGRHIISKCPGAVLEDHCFDDTWKAAVRSMLAQNAIVLMDLRGFGPERQGCIYELGVLRDCITMRCVVFLIDHTTDLTFLKNTLQRLWKSMAVNSPNATESGSQETGQYTGTHSLHEQVTVFRLSDSESESANQLALLLVEACVAGEQYNQHRGQIALQQLVGDLRLLAATATEQVAAVGAEDSPWELVLDAGYSCDPDLDTPGHLLSPGD